MTIDLLDCALAATPATFDPMQAMMSNPADMNELMKGLMAQMQSGKGGACVVLCDSTPFFHSFSAKLSSCVANRPSKFITAFKYCRLQHTDVAHHTPFCFFTHTHTDPSLMNAYDPSAMSRAFNYMQVRYLRHVLCVFVVCLCPYV